MGDKVGVDPKMPKQNADSADAFREAGVTLFQTELTAANGYDLVSLKEVLTWRDQ